MFCSTDNTAIGAEGSGVWGVALCRLANRPGRFEGPYCLCLKGLEVREGSLILS